MYHRGKMDKLKLQLCDFLWKYKCCLINKNKKTRDYELKLLPEKILQHPYLLRCFIYLIKQSLKQIHFNCILTTDKNTYGFSTIIAYELGVPIYTNSHDIKNLVPLYIRFSISLEHSLEKIKHQKIGLVDCRPMKNKQQNTVPSILHIYELLDYGFNNKLINEDDWELCHMYYYDKIPFEYRHVYIKDIENRNKAITKCYNLLYKKKSNLILDCSGYGAIDTLKLISTYGEYFFIIIVDSDCFTTFTKKHRECFINTCKEKSLLIYDRLRVEKLQPIYLKKIIEKKLGKENWLNGFFIYSYSDKIISFFSENYPSLGLFFENKQLEESIQTYTQFQQNITQSIGIILEDKRKNWHNDSRIFYVMENKHILDRLNSQSITHSILFDNYDFLIIKGEQITDIELLEPILCKSWSLFKNKF